MEACIPSQRKADLPPQLQPPNPLGVIALLIFTYVCISSLLSFYLGPSALFITMIWVLCMLMLAGEAGSRRYPSIAWLVVIGWATVGAACLVGISNYHINFAPYRAAKASRDYTGVGADEKAASYLDAGTLKFHDSALDDTRALGWRGHDYTYCVAPIVMSNVAVGPQDAFPQVQFWAIGLDCCAARGSFECDGAADIDAQGGLVLHEASEGMTSSVFAPKSKREQYLHAVKAACALYGLETAAEPVLLRWVASPEGVLSYLHSWSMLTWLLSVGIHAAIVTVAWSMIHTHFDTKIRLAIGVPGMVEPTPSSGPGPATGGADTGTASAPRGSSSMINRTKSTSTPQQDPFLIEPH